MAFTQFRGRIRSISARRPLGFRCCDRCNAQYSRNDLRWQYEWAGSTLQNLRILVCPTCLDIPQPQLRTYVVPPDPLPFWNPRPELDRAWPMQTFPLRSNNGLLIRANDSSVITIIGSQPPAYPERLRDSEGNLIFDNGDVLDSVYAHGVGWP